MKLVSYRAEGERPKARRLGIILEGDTVADARAGYARLLDEKGDLQAEERHLDRTHGGFQSRDGEGARSWPRKSWG